MVRLRHQLAAYSPIGVHALVDGAIAASGARQQVRAQLSALLRERYVAADCVLCGSGTQALQLALSTSTRSGAALVAMPAFNCYDVAAAAIGAGVRVALYDIDPSTLGPDMESLERVLSAGASAAVVAPLYGIPLDWRSISVLAERFGAVLIEDAAQGHGASWEGRPFGALGPVSTLSFGRGKGWTGGNGGAVLRRSAESSPDIPVADTGPGNEAKAGVGMLAQWLLGRPDLYGLPRSIPALGLGETAYHPPRTPVNITRAAAAAVLANTAAAEGETVVRRANAAAFEARLAGSGAQAIPVPKGGTGGYIRFPLRLRGGVAALDSVARATRLGVAPSYPQPLSTLTPFVSRLEQIERRFPGAECLVAELVTLPTHSRLLTSEREEIVDLIVRGTSLQVAVR